MNRSELESYWLESSDRDFQTMHHLYEKGDYSWSLFMGHLVLEKLLKAYFVKTVSPTPPYIHNLLRIAEKATLDLDDKQKDFLATVTTFNLRARYDDYKMEFYLTCTQSFSKKWIDEIKEFRTWIKNKF